MLFSIDPVKGYLQAHYVIAYSDFWFLGNMKRLFIWWYILYIIYSTVYVLHWIFWFLVTIYIYNMQCFFCKFFVIYIIRYWNFWRSSEDGVGTVRMRGNLVSNNRFCVAIFIFVIQLFPFSSALWRVCEIWILFWLYFLSWNMAYNYVLVPLL